MHAAAAPEHVRYACTYPKASADEANKRAGCTTTVRAYFNYVFVSVRKSGVLPNRRRGGVRCPEAGKDGGCRPVCACRAPMSAVLCNLQGERGLGKQKSRAFTHIHTHTKMTMISAIRLQQMHILSSRTLDRTRGIRTFRIRSNTHASACAGMLYSCR